MSLQWQLIHILSRRYCASSRSKSIFKPVTFRHQIDTNKIANENGERNWKRKNKSHNKESKYDNNSEYTPITRPIPTKNTKYSENYVPPIETQKRNYNKFSKLKDSTSNKQTFDKNRYHEENMNYTNKSTKYNVYKKKAFKNPKSLFHPNDLNLNVSEDGQEELLYGIFPILLALKANRRTFHEILFKHDLEKSNENIKNILDLSKELNINTRSVDLKTIRRIVPPSVVHQNVCSIASPLPIDVFTVPDTTIDTSQNIEDIISSSASQQQIATREEILATKKKELYLVLDEVVDPMNMGAILRSSCYFGVDRVFITPSWFVSEYFFLDS